MQSLKQMFYVKNSIKTLIEMEYAYPYLNSARIKQTLKYYHKALHDVLHEGERQVFDFCYSAASSFRYNYVMPPSSHQNDERIITTHPYRVCVDDPLCSFIGSVKDNLYPLISKMSFYPFVYALDLVVDNNGNCYVLEMNTHPEVPVQAYRYMLDGL